MKLSSQFAALLASISISVSIASPIFDSAVVDKSSAPLLSSTSAAENEIPNNYIVVFKKHVDDSAASEHQSWVTSIHKSSISELKKRSQAPLLQVSDEASASDWFDTDLEMLNGLKHSYNISGLLSGYSGSFDDSVLDAIRKHPDVSLSSPNPSQTTLVGVANLVTGHVPLNICSLDSVLQHRANRSPPL